MEKENIMPIVLGAEDVGFVRKYISCYGSPAAVLDTKRSFRLFFEPRARFIKMTSDSDDIVFMYISSLLEGTDRMPLLAAGNEKYKGFVERNKDRLATVCILWHENFKF